MDHVENLGAESLDEPLGVNGTDAANHSRGEIFLHALDRSGRRGLEKLCPELEPVGAIILPNAARRHPFASRNGRRMSDNGEEVLVASRFDPQNAEAVLLVVERDPLHKPGKNLTRFVSLRHVQHHRRASNVTKFWPRLRSDIKPELGALLL